MGVWAIEWLSTAFAWLLKGISDMFSGFGGFFVAKALGFLGLSLSSATFVVGPLLDQVAELVQGMDGSGETMAYMMAWLGYTRFDVAVTMLLSAHGMHHVAEGIRVFLRKVA